MMSNIILQRTFDVPIFPVNITVIVTRNPLLAFLRQVKARKLKPDRDDGLDDNCNAICWRHNSQIFVIFAVDTISHSLISHELKHAVDEIFKFIEAKPATEIYEYLLGYVTSRVYRLIKKYKIRLHK
jgi:hypothetical protein